MSKNKKEDFGLNFYKTHTKYFIVCKKIEDYHAYIKKMDLDPGCVFWDSDEHNADISIRINLSKSLPAKKIMLDRVN